ncbi:MAG: hypothetical protein AAGA96_12535 [Verrucomicrobiota bacterium]
MKPTATSTSTEQSIPEIETLVIRMESGAKESKRLRINEAVSMGAPIALNDEQAEDLVDKFRMIASPPEKRLILNRLLQGMTLENAAAVRSAFENLSDKDQHYRYFMRLGELGGFNMVDSVIGSRTVFGWERGGAMAGWARVDLNGAYAHWQSLERGSDDYRELTEGLALGWAALDPIAATEFVVEANGDGSPEETWEMLATIREQMDGMRSKIEDFANWAESITDPGVRLKANAEILGRMSFADSFAAAEWASEQEPGTVDIETLSLIASRMGYVNADAAIAYARSQENGDARQSAQRAVAERFFYQNPEAAIKMIQTSTEYVEGDFNSYDKAFEAWGAKDPLSALDWIEQNVPKDAFWEDEASAFYHTLLPWAKESPEVVAEYLNTSASERGYGWGSAAMARSLKNSDPGSAIQWAVLNPDSEWREELIYEVGETYIRRNREAALQAFDALGLDEETVERLKGSRR